MENVMRRGCRLLLVDATEKGRLIKNETGKKMIQATALR